MRASAERRAARRRSSPLLFLLATVSVAAFDRANAATPETPLRFQIKEGGILNAFYQQGPISAHLLLSSGTKPRVLVAFPAGNSGVGVWFEDADKPVNWTLGGITGVSQADSRGRMMHGITATASIDARVVVREAVLSSVRVLRDYQIKGEYPPELESSARIAGSTVEWARSRLDGAAGYALSISVDNGKIIGGQGRPLTLSPSQTGEPMRLRITALTGETPLTPLGSAGLLNSSANDDLRSRQVLSFLSYQEKFLAGSWRFNTYFGRDTLMSLRLLMPALQPQAIERGLASVLQRLAANGEVAHEEDVGEFAVLRHRKERGEASAAPIYDYKMIDDDFMLAPVAAAYLFEHVDGHARAAKFLAERLPNGERVGAALARNFLWVTQAAHAFAQTPTAANLIPLKQGVNVGEWRDSEDGLAGGRYPFDVNAVLVPAALASIGQFASSGHLKPYVTAQHEKTLSKAAAFSDVWSREAPALFRVTLNDAEARREIIAYAKAVGVHSAPALQSLRDQDVVLNAIALDARYQPIPVMHSDGGFALLLQNPPAARVEELAEGMLRPFPAGLLTDAGLLVANPVFADDIRQRQLDRAAYHGTVIWSWQQAMLAAGLERQLARRDLPAATARRLHEARERLWSVIENTRDMRASELWSWRFEDGRYQAVPFGQSSGDADESNAAQLWSTVYLGIPEPENTARTTTDPP